MRIAGFDCSTKSIACVILDENKQHVYSCYVSSAKDSMDLRLDDLSKKMFLPYGSGTIERNIFSNKVSLCVVENPIYLQNIKATSGIAQIVGMVKHISSRYDVSFMGIDNKSWKKSVLGSGKASKEEIMKFAVDNWYEEFITNQDLADAACIALWGVLRKSCKE